MPGERVSASVRLRIFFNRLDAPPNETTRAVPPPYMQSRSHCTLHWLRDALHLFSFLSSSGSPLMLRHFTQHYLNTLGVDAARARFVVLEQGGSSDHVAALLVDEAHVPAGNVQILRGVAYSDALKIEHVNAYIRTLPHHAWLIFADSDEFFTYPCNLPHLVRAQRETLFGSSMVDRLALDGSIAPVRRSPSLAEQYPLECRLRQLLSTSKLGSFFTGKVVLHRVFGGDGDGDGPRTFRNPHSLAGVHWTKLRTFGSSQAGHEWPFAHYTLTEEALNGTLRKIRAHELEAQQRLERNVSVLEFVKGELNSTTIVCSLGYDPKTGVCRDYTFILFFMRAQQRNPSRNLAPFCYRAPERPEDVRRCDSVVRTFETRHVGGVAKTGEAWLCQARGPQAEAGGET